MPSMTPGHNSISMHGVSHPGGRSNNQDSFAVLPERGFAVIADGMGGLGRGELASKTVVDTMVAAFAHGIGSMEDSILDAHANVAKLRTDGSAGRLGSTVVSVLLSLLEASVYWVGDSRAYLFRDGALSQVTRDHSLVAELMGAGAISLSEAATHPQRNVLTRAIGVRDAAPIVDSVTLTLQAGDCLMMCSDGLCGYVSDAEIADAMRSGSAAERAEQLVQYAVSINHAADNVTVVTILVEA
jgi:serine/threonine protein phosphatase PrpC